MHLVVSDRTWQRSTVRFSSGADDCEAWLYLPALGDGIAASGERAPGAGGAQPAGTSYSERHPVVVMAHGLGGVRTMRLGAFAERFAAAGYACLVFDYRGFGHSGGMPRQVLDVRRQLQDWGAAVAWARARPELDPDRVVLWGTSFSGGHVLQVASDDPRVAAVVAQCPFVDGPASVAVAGRASALKVTWLAVLDVIAALRGAPPVYVAAGGPPGSTALMTAPDVEPGYMRLVDPDDDGGFENRVAARFALDLLRYRPGANAASITCPVLFGLCERDSVAPVAAAQRVVARVAHAEARLYPCGHFDVYVGEDFEVAVADQLAFLAAHVPVAAAAR